MTDLIAALVGLALFAAFVGYLALSIAEPSLLLIVAATLVMAAVDFWRSAREP